MNNFWVILKKELTDIFRDKKTLIFTILLPVILYPTMFKIIDVTIKDTTSSVEKNLIIAYEGNKETSLYKTIDSMDNITIDEEGNSEEKLKQGKISLILKVPEDFEDKIADEKKSDINIIYDENSNKSMIASSMIKEIFNQYSKSIVDGRLQAKGISSEVLTPFDIREETLSKEEQNPMAYSILSMLPTIIIIFMISPTIGIAADLVAGEKERGTFEPLLSTSVGRTSIFWGKLVAISSIALITLATSLTAMIASMTYMFSGGGKVNIPLGAFGIIAIVSIFVLIALSSLEISISIYARSMKEANTYLGGFLVPVMILTYIPFMMDAKSISFIFFNIPIVNAVAVMKEAVAGIFNPMHIAVVLGWYALYVIGAVFFAKFMFSKEEVVFRS